MAAVSVFVISPKKKKTQKKKTMRVGVDEAISVLQLRNYAHLRETGENTAADYFGLRTPPVKYLPVKSDHADTDYKAVVAFWTLQSPFHWYTEAAEVVSWWGNTWTWILSFWRYRTAVVAACIDHDSSCTSLWGSTAEGGGAVQLVRSSTSPGSALFISVTGEEHTRQSSRKVGRNPTVLQRYTRDYLCFRFIVSPCCFYLVSHKLHWNTPTAKRHVI